MNECVCRLSSDLRVCVDWPSAEVTSKQAPEMHGNATKSNESD